MLKCLHHTIGNPAPDKANQRYCQGYDSHAYSQPFMFDCKKTAKVINANLRNNSAFANGEVKEVREVKAICFTDRYSTKKAVDYNF